MKAVRYLPETEYKNLRKDNTGAIEVKAIIVAVILTVVLVTIVAALFGTLNSALADYAANETTFGPVVQDLVPLLIGVGILLALVVAYLKFADVM